MATTNKKLQEAFELGALSNKRALTLDEFCLYTGYTKSYAYKLTCLREVPFSKPNGKKIYFDREKIDQWLLRNPSKTNSELEAAADSYVSTK